jgi:anti-sigma B factor antagonist
MDHDPKPDGLVLRIDGGTISVAGELDVATAPLLIDAIAAVTHGPVTIDLEEVGFIDSSGLGAVVAAHQRLAADGRRLHVKGRSPTVIRVFEVSGVAEILGIGEDSDDDSG